MEVRGRGVRGNNAHTGGHYDTGWQWEESIFPFRQVVRRKKWEEWERRTKWAENKGEIEMHSTHSHVSNLAAFIAGLWDLCFHLTRRQSPVWYSPWQLNMGTNFRVAVWIQILNIRPTASMLCRLWTGEELSKVLRLELMWQKSTAKLTAASQFAQIICLFIKIPATRSFWDSHTQWGEITQIV